MTYTVLSARESSEQAVIVITEADHLCLVSDLPLQLE